MKRERENYSYIPLDEIIRVLEDGIKCGIYCEQNGLDYVYFDPAFIYQITEKKAVRSYRFRDFEFKENIYNKLSGKRNFRKRKHRNDYIVSYLAPEAQEVFFDDLDE